MKIAWLLLAAPLAAAGCSAIYDIDSLRGRDAMPVDAPAPDAMPLDAPAPDATPPDATPDADQATLVLSAVTPDHVLEGVGSGASRPAFVLVDGAAIAPDVAITIAWADDGSTTNAPTLVDGGVLPGGAQAVLALSVPVNGPLLAGQHRDARLTFTQVGGTVVQWIDVTIDGLAELTLAAVATSAQSGTYSTINVASATHVSGTTPVILHATGDITIHGVLDVDAVGRFGGPHGCDGGTSASASGCGTGGGGEGADSAVLGAGAGGGGGGFGSTGGVGGGDGGGNAGMTSGAEMLVPIATPSGNAGNRGNGGGGGGTGTLGAAGGDGGGGGGVLELDAGGSITISGSGALRAKGGNGGGSAGGGGGGSGGALLVRAGGGVVAPGVWLSAPGGNGSNATNDGGNGGVGRIRVDTATGSVAAMATTPAAVRGPAWSSAPVFAVSADVTLTLFGKPGATLPVRVDDVASSSPMIGAGGSVDVALTLTPGLHDICAVADPANLGEPEALGCVQVAFVP